MVEYWLVDINRKEIEVYSKPSGETYTSKRIASQKDSVNIPTLDTALRVEALLGS